MVGQNLTGSAEDADLSAPVEARAKDLITTAQAAAMIPGCNDQKLRRWAKAGKIRAVRLPSNELLFVRQDIEELLVPRFLTSERAEVPGQGRLPV